MVALTVGVAGNTQDVRVARSMAEDVSKKDKQTAVGLDEKAVEAVTQYRFQAGQFQGKPVPVEIEVNVNCRNLPNPTEPRRNRTGAPHSS